MLVLRVVHVLVAAAWFGHKLLVPYDLREATTTPAAADAAFVRRLGRAQALGIASGVATLATGLGLYVWIGPAVVSSTIHIGLAVAIGMFAVGAIVARPGWDRLRAGMESGDSVAVAAGSTRLSRALVLESGLWIVVLVTMLA